MFSPAIAKLASALIGATLLSLGILPPLTTQAMTLQFEGNYQTYSGDSIPEIPFSGEITVDEDLLQSLLEKSLDGLTLISSQPVFDPSAVLKINFGGTLFENRGMNINPFVALNGPFTLLTAGVIMTSSDFTLSVNRGCVQNTECKAILSKNDSASPIGGYDFPIWRVTEDSESVPEPPALLGLGAIGILLFRKRCKAALRPTQE